MEPRAAIFDVDGVLVDSYRAHYESWRRLAAEEGLDLTEAQFARTFGRTSRDIIAELWPGRDPDPARVRELDDRKEALYRAIVAEAFPAMPGARALLQALDRAGFRLAVASSGPPENVALALDRLEVAPLVDAVVTGRDVERGKPDPQGFLLAAARLGVAPARAIVIEDAPPGVEAAARAGMKAVVLLSTGRRPEEFSGLRPALVVRSLEELTPERLAALLDHT
ncbi:MAG TPA: HAD family phosphatase [Vicinamibacterales bacterium]|nr:HAD family phosphatase [Vicinamibacterales bacterium]